MEVNLINVHEGDVIVLHNGNRIPIIEISRTYSKLFNTNIYMINGKFNFYRENGINHSGCSPFNIVDVLRNNKSIF